MPGFLQGTVVLCLLCSGSAMLPGLEDFADHPSDYQSELASADFDVCKSMVHDMHKNLRQDRSRTAVMAAFQGVRSGLPSHQQPLCDHFMNENTEDVVSLLQVEQIDMAMLAASNPDLAASAAEAGGGGIPVPKPPAYSAFNAFGEKDKAKMEQFWAEKGQYCSSCLGIMGRLTRYLQRNNTQDAVMLRINRLCQYLPKDLQEQCDYSINMGWGGYVLSSFIARNRLPYLCLKAGLCEATVIVSPKKSAVTKPVAFAAYGAEPIVVPPKAYTKPIITFPSDKTKPPTLRFAQKDQYDREPEVTLKKENFYDPKLLQGEVVRDMKKAKNPFATPDLPPTPVKFSHVLAVKEVSFLETNQAGNDTETEPTILAPPPIMQKEKKWWKVAGSSAETENDLTAGPDQTAANTPMYNLEASDPDDDEGPKVKIAPPNFFDPQVMINTKADYAKEWQAKRGYEAPMEGIPATAVGDQDCMGALGQPAVGGRGPCLRMGGLQVGGMGPIIPGEIASATSPDKFVGVNPIFHRGCSVCTFMIKSMDEFMRSSRTLRSISPLIARLCDKCNTKAESTRCKAMIQKHGYKMYQIFVTKLSAEIMCPEIGLCDMENFRATPELLPQAYNKAITGK